MKLFKFPLIALLLLALSACNNSNDEDTLIVGTSADNPPYEYIRANQILGLDIDVIEEIGKQLGKKITIKNMDFNGLLAALTSKQIDLVISGLSITPERQKIIDFSDSYVSANIAVLYRVSDHFNDVSSLDGKVVGAQLGTLWSQFAQSLTTKHNIQVITLTNNISLVEELKSGAVDAVVLEHQQASNFIENNPSLASFVAQNIVSDFAIAFPKNSSLKPQIDRAIAKMKAEGTIDKLMRRWLKSEF